MSDQVLYRKYRSASFDQVVGQNHVVATLQSALASGRLSHAYLFTGPRGVGKTSVARLLARALNCTGQPKPCNQCPNCLAALNSSLDVIEIDAASNRSIDAVRDLKDKIALAPTTGAYKIYIIDEVHMLTAEAFNALLKTLEEPPAHAVFVLATTEAHKLPDTIISRTQRFNFKPISTSDLIAHLTTIAKSEKITVDAAALDLIAAAARGSFRDAIGLLDQLAASSNAAITASAARELLGFSAEADIVALSQAIADRDTRAALEVLGRLDTAGAQPGQTAAQLAEFWRAILLAATSAEAAPAGAIELAAVTTPSRAATVITALLDVTRSHWPQLALEATVAQLTAPAPTASTQPATAAATPVSAAPLPARPAPKPPASPEAVKPAPSPPPTPQTTPEPAPTAAPSGPQLSADLWPKVLVLLKTHNNSLCALLQMYPAEFGAGEITIRPRFNFHRDLFLKPANLKLIEGAATKVYGSPVKIFARTNEAPSAQGSRAKGDTSTELVSSALEILGGEVIE